MWIMLDMLWVAVDIICGNLRVGTAFCAVICGSIMTALHVLSHHRYKSHNAFETSRCFAVVLNVIGSAALRVDALWYARVHKQHHMHCETEQDPYGGSSKPLLYNMSEFLLDSGHLFPLPGTEFPYVQSNVEDRILNTLWFGPYCVFLIAASWAVSFQFAMYSQIVCIVLISLAMAGHFIGEHEPLYDEACQARNSLVLGLVTMGEGYHANHHNVPKAANIGFNAYQPDLAYFLLCAMKQLRLVWNIQTWEPSTHRFEGCTRVNKVEFVKLQSSIVRSRKISMAELSRHCCLKTDCWVAIHGVVYDITKWTLKHPGGQQMFVIYGGKDVTLCFETQHGSSVLKNKTIVPVGIVDVST